MEVSFIINEMSYMRYVIPLIDEYNKNGVSSTFYIVNGTKYNAPNYHLNSLKEIAKTHLIKLKDISELSNSDKIIYLVEGAGINFLKRNNQCYILTAMRDFATLYEKYEDRAKCIFFASDFFIEHYEKKEEKSFATGIPKYDVILSKEAIINKYNFINKQKRALVIFPRLRDLHNIDINTVYDLIRKIGYIPVVKTRAKDPAPKNLRGDVYFEDFSWYPHTTMELMVVSDFVVNFSSTAIKECMLLDIPLINFHIKPFKRPFDFLYNDNESCVNVTKNISLDSFAQAVDKIVKCEKKVFKDIREKFLFEPGKSSEKIIQIVKKYEN